MINITKQDIIDTIRRTAKENGGVPLGIRRFEKKTGITRYNWRKYWSKISDAQREAGFDPNTLTIAYDNEFLFEKFITLMRELGRYPTQGDLLVKRNSDPDFPSCSPMARIGNKKETTQKILDYATQKGYSDIVELCRTIIESLEEDKDDGIFDAVKL